MIEVVNRQRRRKIDPEPWREFAAKALREIEAGEHEATIAFVSNVTMRSLNKRFRGLDKTTDVLSFPSESEAEELPNNLGDIAISVEQAELQSRQNGLTLDHEISQLILHGLLHLCGYDHETDSGEMNRLELRLRKKLKI
jgi:probable rRNA maturation factor